MTDAPESGSRAADAEDATGSADLDRASAAVPVDAVPVDAVPVDAVPVDAVPVDAVPDGPPTAGAGSMADAGDLADGGDLADAGDTGGAGTGSTEPTSPSPAAESEGQKSPLIDSAGAEPDAGSNSAPGESTSRDRQVDVRLLEREGDIAADYLEGLLDIADLDGDIDMDVEADRASVSIVGGDLKSLVGRDGQVLEALQELTRLAVQAKTGGRSRLMLDIAGHRAARRRQLAQVARRAVEDARRSGQPVRLDPMTPFERKVVHDTVASAGLTSESEGVEPSRCVVVLPG